MVVDGTGAAVEYRPNTSRRHSRRSVDAALSPSNSDALVAKPKPKVVVASRYLLPSSKPTSAAIGSTTTSTTTTCRAASPAAPRRPALLPNAAAGDTVARTVSVAFQGASYCLDAGKARHVSHAAAAAITPSAPPPEKKRSSFAAGAPVRAKVCDARWPASAAANAGPYGFRGVAARSLAFDEMTPRRASVDIPNPLRTALSSDTESATSSAVSPDGDADAKLAPSARLLLTSIMASPARFSRDAMGSRSERFADNSTPFMSRTPRFLASPSPKTTAPATAATKKKSVKSLFNGLLSSPFTKPSPKQPTPTKPAAISPVSPSPVRSSATVAAHGPAGKLLVQSKASSSGCNSDGDMRRVVKAEEEHLLRLLHNRHLQWRLANAQADAAISAQASNAQKHFCGAWVTILGMHKSISLKKLQLQSLRHNCKLMAILRGQMVYLEEWSLLENKYANSLSGTVEALNATILRLPVSDRAMADFQAVKNAVGSAVDVMQTMRNSMSTLLPKLARTNVLVSQLSRIVSQEQVLMAQCRELLSTLALMHVKYSSQQGQMIQLIHPKSSADVSISEYPY